MARNKSFHTQLAEAIHQAVLTGELPPNENPFKKLRNTVVAVIEGMNTTLLFDIILTNDVILDKAGVTIIYFPEDERRKNAEKIASDYKCFLDNNPLCKKN